MAHKQSTGMIVLVYLRLHGSLLLRDVMGGAGQALLGKQLGAANGVAQTDVQSTYSVRRPQNKPILTRLSS